MPLSGQQVQAAREGVTVDTGVPTREVAERAAMGISALYLSYEGPRRNFALVGAALADEGDPWETFVGFMRRADTDTHSLTLRLAGTFAPWEKLNRGGERAHGLTERLLERTKSAGVLRPDSEAGDLTLILEQLATVRVGDGAPALQLGHRHLAPMLDVLSAPSAPPLPGPAPAWEVMRRLRDLGSCGLACTSAGTEEPPSRTSSRLLPGILVAFPTAVYLRRSGEPSAHPGKVESIRVFAKVGGKPKTTQKGKSGCPHGYRRIARP
jgi:hypothetical protein